MNQTFWRAASQCYPDQYNNHAIHQVSRRYPGTDKKCSRCKQPVWKGRAIITPSGQARWFAGYLVEEWP